MAKLEQLTRGAAVKGILPDHLVMRTAVKGPLQEGCLGGNCSPQLVALAVDYLGALRFAVAQHDAQRFAPIQRLRSFCIDHPELMRPKIYAARETKALLEIGHDFE